MLPETIKQLIKRAEQAGNEDLVSKELPQIGYSAHMLYLRTICNADFIRRDIIHPFTEKPLYEDFSRYLTALPEASPLHDSDGLERKLYEGYVLLFAGSSIWAVMARSYEGGPVGDTKVENVIQGPQDSFASGLDVNLNLIRNRYVRPTLRIKKRKAGIQADNKLALVYDEAAVREGLVEELERRLDNLEASFIQSAGHLQRLLSVGHGWTPFPNMLVTERPDRTVLNLTSGKVVILIEGENFALIAPSVFLDFFSSMDDISNRLSVSIFLTVLRSLALFTATTLPAFYVAITSFNPELIRVQLALIVAGTRASVPYPPVLEVLFMLVMMEFLTEASVRLPKAIGPAATTVGGLILGQAATSAGLVGDIMIIIVASVAISNFVIPVGTMGFAIRILKYPLLVIASWFGLTGILAGLIGLLMYLVHLNSFGEPYFRLFRIRGPHK